MRIRNLEDAPTVHAPTPGDELQVPTAADITDAQDFCRQLEARGHSSEKYQFYARLAQGGMGEIHVAIDQDLKRRTVLKVILPQVMAKPALFRRFVEEARIAAALEHPNIIPVHELGILPDGEPFFAMKYVQGESLAAILGRLAAGDPAYESQYSLFALLTIFRKICDAVAFAHSRRIIHRDIKPDNIMIASYGEVLLMDWGLARHEYGRDGDAGDAEVADGPGDRTRFGVVKGTPAFMSPELAKGLVDEVDHRSDIFLLGATLYTIATLEAPYEGKDVYEILANAASGNFIDARLRAPERQIPGALCRIIHRAMAYAPAERYQSVAELAAEIDALLEGRTDSVHRTFMPGELLMREGEIGSEAYLIVHGEVEVQKEIRGRKVPLVRLRDGDTVGEMAMFSRAPRSASVQAIAKTEVIVITEVLIEQGLEKLPPWMGKIVEAQADRLRLANRNVHPLMRSECIYHVLTQLRMVYVNWGRPAPDAGSDRKIIVLPIAPCIKEISILLSVSVERVTHILARLLKSGLVKPFGHEQLYIPSLSLFDSFIEYARQQDRIESPFAAESRRTVLFCSDTEVISRHTLADASASGEATSTSNDKPEKVLGCDSAVAIAGKFERLHQQIQHAEGRQLTEASSQGRP